MPKVWVKEKCVSCSLCVVLCLFEAFKQKDGEVEYSSSKCMNCEECLASSGCPRRAIK